jgi:hypothetical protein
LLLLDKFCALRPTKEEPSMGEESEPLYDDATVRLMSDAYEAADKEIGTSDKSLQVTMAVAIIRAINEGERDLDRLSALAVSSVRTEDEAKPAKKISLRPGWVNLTALLG